MTDNEIRKALECCIDDDKGCEECPFDQIECITETENKILVVTLDLINRQKEQIKKFENIERFATKTIEKQQAEIERLKVRNDELNALNKTAAKDAIEELEIRLYTQYEMHGSLGIADIKCVVAEMEHK